MTGSPKGNGSCSLPENIFCLRTAGQYNLYRWTHIKCASYLKNPYVIWPTSNGNICRYYQRTDCGQKQQLQNLIFPEGMYYIKKKDTGRADKVNAVFLTMSQLAGKLEENKKGEISFETNFPV